MKKCKLSHSFDPKRKERLLAEGNEVVTKWNQLKMPATGVSVQK